LNIKDSFFSSRLQYHEEMLQLANVFTSCLKSALQGDEIKFRRQLQELMNATKCFPTFSRICSEQNEERLWEAMEIICLKRCLHPSVDITNGGGIIFVEPPQFMPELLELLWILKSACMSSKADSTKLSYEMHILQRHLAWKLKPKHHISVSMELFSKLESLLRRVELDDIVREPLWVACLATIVHSLRHSQREDAFECSRKELINAATESERVESTATSSGSNKSIPLSSELANFLQRLNVTDSRSYDPSFGSTHSDFSTETGRVVDTNCSRSPIPLILLIETLRSLDTTIKRFHHKMESLSEQVVSLSVEAASIATSDSGERSAFESVNWASDKISTDILFRMLYLLSTKCDKSSSYDVGVVDRATSQIKLLLKVLSE